MRNFNLLSEQELRRIIETSEAAQAEKSFKSLLMIYRMNDTRTPNVRNHYYVKLYDNPLPDGTTYKLADAEIAHKVLNNLIGDSELSDGGRESDNSMYLGFYAE